MQSATPPEKDTQGTGAAGSGMFAAPPVQKKSASPVGSRSPAISSRAETMAETKGARRSGAAASPTEIGAPRAAHPGGALS